jgi:hypothetical protein
VIELSSWWWCSRFRQSFFVYWVFFKCVDFFLVNLPLFFLFRGSFQNSFRHVHNIVPCTYTLFFRLKFRTSGCCISLILLMFVFTLCVRRTSRASGCWILPFLSFIFEGLVTKTWRGTLSYDFGFCSQISSSLMRDPCQSGQVLDVNAQCHLVSLRIPIQLEIG